MSYCEETTNTSINISREIVRYVYRNFSKSAPMVGRCMDDEINPHAFLPHSENTTAQGCVFSGGNASPVFGRNNFFSVPQLTVLAIVAWKTNCLHSESEIGTGGFSTLDGALENIRFVSHAPAWFSNAISEDKNGKHVQALNRVFREVDDLLSRGQFREVDQWLFFLKPSELSVNLIGGVLSITRPASEHLKYRDQFFDSAWSVIQSRGRDASKLLNGLKGQRASDGVTARGDQRSAQRR